MDDDEVAKHAPRNRASAASKLRRSRRNCPVCVAPLAKNARRTKLQRRCEQCGAHPQPGKSCARCAAEAIWENRTGAACESCGLHGTKAEVIRP